MAFVQDALQRRIHSSGPVVKILIIQTLITPAPLCANMIQILVHTYRDLGCSIFEEINVKRQSNPSPLIVHGTYSAKHN